MAVRCQPVRQRLRLTALFQAACTLAIVLIASIGSCGALAVGHDSATLRGLPEDAPADAKIYSLSASVDVALKKYPTLSHAKAREQKTNAGVALAKTAYLPTFDLLAQELRTTTNVAAGTIFPQVLDVIPMQTGQESNSSRFKSVWSNNFGANFSWELWDFGLRHANLNLARSKRSEMQADIALTALDVAARVAERYLTTVAAAETIHAREANLKRMQAWQLVVHTLVDKGLKPGVDSSRANADVAAAKIAVLDAQEETELSRVDLSEAMGIAGTYVDVESTPWIHQPQAAFQPGKADLLMHPYAILNKSAITTAHSNVKVWDKTWYPHLYFHSAIWGRGSGIQQHPNIAAGGILPQIGNYVAGLSVAFPLMSVYSVRAQRAMAQQEEAANKAKFDLAMQELTQKDGRAKVLLDNAIKVAAETPTLVTAARENEMKALERYKVGLSNIVEVAESERILADAEVKDAVAQVRVWRAILAITYAHGDLKPFLDLARQAEASSK